MKLSPLLCTALWLSSLGSFAAIGQPVGMQEAALRAKAERLAQKFIIVDTHIDLPYRLSKSPTDVSIRTPTGDFDYPRAKAGGLNVAFMSVYVPAEHDGKSSATRVANSLIDIVESLVKRWPDKFAVARSPEDVARQSDQGKISLAMGMENGSGVGKNLKNVRYFYDRGIRYITLTHAKNNDIADASYAKTRRWHGLSPFGRKLIAEMNRVGIMVDVSHVSDSAFFQVVRLSKAPVIASHSGCRAFTPGWQRNMSDEMIRALASCGGTIQINFGGSFLVDSIRRKVDDMWPAVTRYAKSRGLSTSDSAVVRYAQEYHRQHGIAYAHVADVARHIDHVVKLVGIDHVGFGSDFDGVGDDLPIGLKDVSGYPNLIYELLTMGYTEKDIEKVCSGNLLRVWTEVSRVARELQGRY